MMNFGAELLVPLFLLPTTSPSLTLWYSSFQKEENFSARYFSHNFPSFWKEGWHEVAGW
jgi:hypothetical protein